LALSKLFSIADLTQAAKVSNTDVPQSAAQCIKFMTMHMQRIESIKQLTHIPEEDELVLLFTLKSFNAFTFIPYLIKEVGYIDRLIVSTYSINRRIIDSMLRYQDKGKIGSIKIYISDSIRYRLPKVVDHLNASIADRAVEVIYTWIHAKISLVEISGSRFTVSGSGNWGENAQYEQYFFLSNPDCYEFYKSALHELE